MRRGYAGSPAGSRARGCAGWPPGATAGAAPSSRAAQERADRLVQEGRVGLRLGTGGEVALRRGNLEEAAMRHRLRRPTRRGCGVEEVEGRREDEAARTDAGQRTSRVPLEAGRSADVVRRIGPGLVEVVMGVETRRLLLRHGLGERNRRL